MIKVFCGQCRKDVPFYLPAMLPDGAGAYRADVGCPNCNELLVTLTGFDQDRVKSEGRWVEVLRHGIANTRMRAEMKADEVRLAEQFAWEASGGE